MSRGAEINKSAIRRFSQEIEREFARNPIRIPVEADSGGFALAPATTVNNYHGPVVTVHGDHAQLAWNNESVHQSQERMDEISPGYGELARIMTDFIANLDIFCLGEDEGDARASADVILGEVIKKDPDQSIIKRSLTMIKGLLAPVATGIGTAVTLESTEAARHVIETLGKSLPF